ncbi:hypothetical protein IQ260_21550 [Leptolyngbya cf. ectocarpi LEGE 11479]|uniref:Uncharacterized protein n=1 Tax=Leptolyngbya cf. ectocarpi LEGE 11479 TaxID=1828722 RepID=A0A929FBQ5_LEPEC|nr:hypothetical protein [Leptolyngbya ectocarpi]MBE9069234.1 hypothetical protein [Leptolyngbya cf. ectocarpi LEGE 11479]
MAKLQIAIEGAGADVAAAALVALDGVDGSYAVSDAMQKDGGLTAVATIVGIVGGVMIIAEQLHKWYVAWREQQADQPTIDKVLIVTAKGRLLLEEATVEDIAKALESLAK